MYLTLTLCGTHRTVVNIFKPWMVIVISVFCVTQINGNQDVMNIALQIKRGLAKGFSDHWALLQNIRYQGIQRHQALLHIYKAINKLNEQVKELQDTCHEKRDRNEFASDQGKSTYNEGPRCVKPFFEIEGSCFYVEEGQRLSWRDARKQCKTLGADLADMRRLNHMRLLRKHLESNYGATGSEVSWPFWIGAHYTRGYWIWADRGKGAAGSYRLDDQIWANGEPKMRNKPSFANLCLLLNGFKHYKGTAFQCNRRRRFVCSIP